MKFILLFASLALPGIIGAAQFDDIVYSASGELYTVSAVPGTKERHLMSGYEYGSPAWRPDGKVLVVQADVHDGPSNLLIIDEKMKVVRTVTKSSNFIRPAWNPEGKHFFALNYSLGHAIGRWNAEGTAFTAVPVRTKEVFEYVQMIAFAPNGKYAALLVDDFKKMLIARVSESAFDVEQVLPTNFSYVAQSAWLDNHRLLFVGQQDGPRAQLWELQVFDGSVKPRGIEGLWIRDFLALSPDRTSVVVCGTADGAEETRWSLWKYSLTSSELTRLTNGIEDVEPVWRP